MIRYLDGNKEADEIIDKVKGRYGKREAVLAVRGHGPFRQQIERMAAYTSIRIIEHPFLEVNTAYDVDTVNKRDVCDFFTRPNLRVPPPCVVEAIETLIASSGEPTWDITVLGRGRFGAFTVADLARQYGRVTWQSASEPIEKPGIIVNCSREAPESYPDDSIVIDINKLGRLTTAILLLRTARIGHGEVHLV